MKLFAIATAATLALATSASAMASSQVETAAQNALDRYGFSVDASDLSRNQWAGIKAAVSDNDRTRTEVQASIASVLNN